MFLFQSSQQKKLKQDAKNQMQICLRSFDQRSQDKYKKSMQFLSKHIQKNNQDIIEIVVDNIKATIKDDQLPPVRKYQAIKLLRDLMKIEIKNKNKTLGKYVLKKIFKRLVILAAHNAGSNEQDRGKDIFKGVKKDQQKYSILFLNELLLSIEQWAKTWPGVSQGMKKQFNEAYKQLLTNGVKFPKQIVKGPQPQAYRGQDGNRNSLSAYSSVPKRQSFSKNDEKSPIRSVSIDQKPKKLSNQSVSQSMGKLNQKKVKDYFKGIIPPVEQFLLILNEMQNGDDPEILAFLNDMIQQLRNVISAGDAFCTELSPQEMKSDYLGKGVISALDYSQGASKDIKKLLKSNSQFNKFKTKYLKLGNQLIKGLKGILNNQKNETSITTQKSKLEKDVKIERPQVQKPGIKVKQQQPSSAKRLSVPRVSAQNMYSSSSGQPNNWVIRERSEYNSNSHKEQVQVHEKFGSFGIGGIGQKFRNQSKEKQKSNFSEKAATQRPVTKIQINQFQSKKIQTQKELPVSKQVQKVNQNTNGQRSNNKDNTFGSFKISSDQNSKPQSNFEQSHPQFEKAQGKKKVQQVKDSFNQSGFQQQQKVQLPIQEKNSSLQQSGNFFGQFGNQKPIDGLPRGNRNERKKKTGPTTRQFQPNNNPFENNMNSQIGSDSQNFSAFNKDRLSFGGDNSQNQVIDHSTSQFKSKNQNRNSLDSNEVKKSFDDPFANSFELNKSNRNYYDDKNPNFWEGEASKQNTGNIFETEFPKKNSQSRDDQQNFSNNEPRSKVQNPFQNPQFSKRASKSINPFEDDSKSQVSQKNRSSVLNFEMNKSFTKSQRQNPFQNPFQTTSQNLSRTNEQPSNPFQTSKDEFKPPKQPQKYDSVSQQGSFKKVTIPQNKAKNISIENPFETMTENKSQIYDPKQVDQMNQSWKFSIKDRQSNQGFDFDQFQNVQGTQRNSVDTSSFPVVRDSFNPAGSEKKVIQRKKIYTQTPQQNENEKSIHFSQFGDQTDFNNRSAEGVQKQGSKKSFNFSDFGGFQEKPTSKNAFAQFSGFNDENIETKKQDFNAFEMSKNQGSDFFKQTQKSHRNDKLSDDKSHHSGFSAFNQKVDNKSQKNNKSQVDWEDFGRFQKGKEQSNLRFDDNQKESWEFSRRKQDESNVFGTAIETDRYPQESQVVNNYIDKNQLRLQFSENTSKYHSPQFNQKFDTVSQKQQESQFNIIDSLNKIENEAKQVGQSIKFEEFIPVEKKGYAWNPLGLKPQKHLDKIMICTDYDIEQKKKEVEYYERMYNEQKELIQKAKQLYNQARKVYLQKIGKIDNIIKQKQSYKQILTSLKQSNQNKQQQIFLLNAKIKQVSQLKQKILQKEKLFFEKTKTVARQEGLKNANNRTNNNKWQIFNRNLKMMRERQLQYNPVNFSKTGYSYTHY